jgi:hypothetical protein
MAGFADVLKTDEEIWDLVNYVLSVPFEGRHSPYPGDVEGEGDSDKKSVATTNN